MFKKKFAQLKYSKTIFRQVQYVNSHKAVVVSFNLQLKSITIFDIFKYHYFL